MSQEITAQEELYHIQESTNDDGTVDVEIYAWKKDEYDNLSSTRNHEPEVTVEFQLPTVETETERMPWPDKATDDYKFVRLVRQCGFDLASAEQIKGETVRYDGEQLIVPKTKSLKEKLTPSPKWGTIGIILPVVISSLGSLYLFAVSNIQMINYIPFLLAILFGTILIAVSFFSSAMLLIAIFDHPDEFDA